MGPFGPLIAHFRENNHTSSKKMSETTMHKLYVNRKRLDMAIEKDYMSSNYSQLHKLKLSSHGITMLVPVLISLLQVL